MNLNQLGQSAAQFRQATEPMAQADARSLLAQAVPQALEQNDIGAAAGLSASVGEFGPLQSLIAARSKQMNEPSESVIDESQAKVMADLFGMPQLAQNLVGKKKSDAESLIGLAEKGRIAGFKRIDQSLQQQEVARRGQQWTSKTIQNTLAPVKEANKKFDEDISGLDTQLSVFKERPTRAAMQTLATTLARASGQTGALTQLDLDPLLMSTLQSRIVEMQNYLTGSNDQTFDSNAPQVKELERIAKSAIDSANAKRLQKSRGGLERTILENPTVLENSDGAAAVKETAKTLGLDLEIEDRDGRKVAIFKDPKRQERALDASPEGEKTLDWSWVDSIKDAELKADLLAEKSSGRIKTPQALERLRQNAVRIDGGQ